MFNALLRLFRPAAAVTQSEADPSQSVAPGTQIRYRPTLVAELELDHRNLLSLFALITELTNAEDYALAEMRLKEFHALLHKHLLTEKIHLYIYIEHLWPRTSEQHRMVQSYRQEMEGIGKVVVSFLRKYENFTTDPHLYEPLRNDLAKVGAVLSRRIEAEEANLYPLYREHS